MLEPVRFSKKCTVESNPTSPPLQGRETCYRPPVLQIAPPIRYSFPARCDSDLCGKPPLVS
jgi:hypothetical protein